MSRKASETATKSVATKKRATKKATAKGEVVEVSAEEFEKALKPEAKKGNARLSSVVFDKLGGKRAENAWQDRARKRSVSKQLEQIVQIKKEREQEIARSFEAKIPEYLAKRKKEFEELLAKFEIENEMIIEKGEGKVDCLELSTFLSQPLISCGVLTSKVSAEDVMTYSQCFWDCVIMANKNFLYVPTIYQFCGLLGVSASRFAGYQYSQDTDLREAVAMVRDRFIDYYTVKGMTNEINSIVAIFAMKAQYGLRDNDAPQMVVNNNYSTNLHTDLDEVEKRFGLTDKSDIIDISAEV